MTRDPNEWQQDLFDLMANERVRVTISGEMGDVDAVLAVHTRGENLPWQDVAIGHGESWDEAMREMMREYAQYARPLPEKGPPAIPRGNNE